MDRFNGQHAVVTGGTSGIGLATARRLASEGATVLVTGRNPDGIAEANEIEGVTAVANDAGDPESAAALRAAVDDALDGRVDALFLNAGLGAFHPIGALDADAVDNQMDVNVRGPLLQLGALESALPDGATVLFNTSVVNDIGMPNSAVYAASKGAVRSAMTAVASELAPRGIRANAISPGPIDTSFFSRTGLSEDEISGFAEQILSQVPLGRFGDADEIAAAAAFLLSGDASFVTGTELVVDGGMS